MKNKETEFSATSLLKWLRLNGYIVNKEDARFLVDSFESSNKSIGVIDKLKNFIKKFLF